MGCPWRDSPVLFRYADFLFGGSNLRDFGEQTATLAPFAVGAATRADRTPAAIDRSFFTAAICLGAPENGSSLVTPFCRFWIAAWKLGHALVSASVLRLE